VKAEHLTNAFASVATRATLLATTLAVGPASPALADRIPFMPLYSRRARRQIVRLLKLLEAHRAAFTGEPSQVSS
jgi:hypothetical protein